MHDPAHQPDRGVITPRQIAIHTLLFLATVLTVSIQGLQFVGQTAVSMDLMDLLMDGLVFALLLLAFLGAHEFGHYIAARTHRLDVSLPYFIPLPFMFIGTLGAVIRMREPVYSRRHLYDIGIAGPAAGFVVSLIILGYGFATLPGPDFIHNFAGHEDTHAYVDQFGRYPTDATPSPNGETLVLGNTLLYGWMASFFEHAPPMWEMYHYPWLFAGWLGLFFTALNLMPLGQLDGGHILYSLVGAKTFKPLARFFYMAVLMLAGVGTVPFVHELLIDYDTAYATLSWGLWGLASFMMLMRAFRNELSWVIPGWIATFTATLLYVGFVAGFNPAGGYLMWLVWSLFILFGSGIEHPPVLVEQELTRGRRILGWVSMAVFALCISPSPISILF